jgi:hypothetical protein
MKECPGDDVTKSDIYSELRSDIRHFGNLRFAMLTVYMTATASLVIAYYYQSDKVEIPRTFIVYGGFWLTVVFGALEAFLSFYLHSLNKAVKVILGNSYPYLSAHRKPYVLWGIRFLFISIYLFLGYFWWQQFLQ